MIARALKIHDVAEACATFIDRLLTPRNLVYIMEFCEQRNIPDLHAAAYDRFVLMFYDQTTDKNFLEWDVGKVARLLGCDDLKVKVRSDCETRVPTWNRARSDGPVGQLVGGSLVKLMSNRLPCFLTG